MNIITGDHIYFSLILKYINILGNCVGGSAEVICKFLIDEIEKLERDCDVRIFPKVRFIMSDTGQFLFLTCIITEKFGDKSTLNKFYLTEAAQLKANEEFSQILYRKCGQQPVIVKERYVK